MLEADILSGHAENKNDGIQAMVCHGSQGGFFPRVLTYLLHIAKFWVGLGSGFRLRLGWIEV